MSLISYKRGQTSIVIRCKILNSSLATGAGLTGLTFNSTGLIISTIADNESAATVYTQSAGNIETIATLGTFAAPTNNKCRFKEVDATNHKGVYEIQIANARFGVASAKSLLVSISGVTNLAETDFVVPLVDLDPYTAQPIAASVTGNVGGSVASVVGNVGGDIVGNVGGHVGSVTGDVGGNLVGNVNGNIAGDVIGDVLGDVSNTIAVGGSVLHQTGGRLHVLNEDGVSLAVASALSQVSKVVQADCFIDKNVTPWALVFIEAGTGGIGVGTELMRKKLKDVDGNNIGDTSTVIGRSYT